MVDLINYSEALIRQEFERDLIEKAKENPRWFEPLYDHYYQPIFKFLLKRHFDKEVTADICADVFFKALTKIGSFQFKGFPFSSWLYKIALNESNAYFRKQKRGRQIFVDQAVAENVANELATDDNQETIDLLKSAMQDLKPDEIDLIDLRFFSGFSFREVAEMMGITENNAKVRSYRLLDKIRFKMTKK